MCGVVGLVSKNEVAPSIYEALTVIQHRGQDAAGIATLEEGRLHTRKQIGLVTVSYTHLTLPTKA